MPSAKRAKPKSILLVEDEARFCQLLGNELEKTGYRTYAAPEGEAGLYYVRRYRPDLILLDLVMAGMDGFEFLRRLRRQDRKTKVIVISAYPEEVARVSAADLSFDAFFEKPFRLEDLFQQIEKTIGGPR